MNWLKMATGMLPADTSLTDPHPREKLCARTCPRHPPRVAFCARTRYPRACLARGHARTPASAVGQRPARRGRRPRSEPRRLGAGRLAAGIGGSEDGDRRRSAPDLERSRAWRLERRRARPSECAGSQRSRASGGWRRDREWEPRSGKAGVGVARVGEARRPCGGATPTPRVEEPRATASGGMGRRGHG